ncbi:hypothetical protein [Streptococcus suis]|uniref:Uncharacterized protein n=1 Tax=Streptococcus suis TaxID=1307 RepID=A0A1X9I1C5_STRSU|nr:hypothetical protein [Streptococcus suis]ANJ64040.1 hypothetical protein [Streptococcus suis]HEM4781803.1 hypothetical protein [Streptococcus suis]
MKSVAKQIPIPTPKNTMTKLMALLILGNNIERTTIRKPYIKTAINPNKTSQK